MSRPLYVQRSLVLQAWLLREQGPMPALQIGKYQVRLSRYYLAHLASGGRAFSPEDIEIVAKLLASWEAAP